MHAAVEDAGRYSCIVSNTAGEERKNFDLDILGNDVNDLYPFAFDLREKYVFQYVTGGFCDSENT